MGHLNRTSTNFKNRTSIVYLNRSGLDKMWMNIHLCVVVETFHIDVMRWLVSDFYGYLEHTMSVLDFRFYICARYHLHMIWLLGI